MRMCADGRKDVYCLLNLQRTNQNVAFVKPYLIHDLPTVISLSVLTGERRKW